MSPLTCRVFKGIVSGREREYHVAADEEGNDFPPLRVSSYRAIAPGNSKRCRYPPLVDGLPQNKRAMVKSLIGPPKFKLPWYSDAYPEGMRLSEGFAAGRIFGPARDVSVYYTNKQEHRPSCGNGLRQRAKSLLPALETPESRGTSRHIERGHWNERASYKKPVGST